MNEKSKFLNTYPSIANIKQNSKDSKINYLHDKFNLAPKQKNLGKNKFFFLRTYVAKQMK